MNAASPITLFHVLRADGVQAGPFTIAQLRDELKLGRITWQTLVASQGDEEWLPLSTYDDLMTPRAVPRASSIAHKEPVKSGQINLTRAGGVMMLVSGALSLALGFGVIEMIVLAAGIVCAVLGICRS